MKCIPNQTQNDTTPTIPLLTSFVLRFVLFSSTTSFVFLLFTYSSPLFTYFFIPLSSHIDLLYSLVHRFILTLCSTMTPLSTIAAIPTKLFLPLVLSCCCCCLGLSLFLSCFCRWSNFFIARFCCCCLSDWSCIVCLVRSGSSGSSILSCRRGCYPGSPGSRFR